MKQRRSLIAREMYVLSGMIEAAVAKTRRVSDRVDGMTQFRSDEERLIVKQLQASADEAADLGRVAAASMSTAADEFAMFARQRIYFTELV